MIRVLGRLLRGVRAGENKIAWHDPAAFSAVQFSAWSPAFADGAEMPRQFAGRGPGDNLSPPVAWAGVPRGAIELVLIVEDPDAPLPRPAVHLIATGISPVGNGLPVGALNFGQPGIQLQRGTLGKRGYFGPLPPPAHGAHTYVFQFFALGTRLPPELTFNRSRLMRAIGGNVVGRARFCGTFARQ